MGSCLDPQDVLFGGLVKVIFLNAFSAPASSVCCPHGDVLLSDPIKVSLREGKQG